VEQRRVVTVAVMLGMFLAALDTTIVATALPTIARVLGGLELYAWVVASYSLALTAATPLFGGLADRYGRRPVYLLGVATFLAGSALCGAARSMPELVVFRAVQGVGGGALLPVAITIVGDLFSLEERADGDVAMVTDPFSGETWLALKPLVPDVAVALVQIADEHGNAQIWGPRWDNVEQVRASKRTIVIAEQVVREEVIRQNPERTVIPGLHVSHVVELPFAAHPTSVYGLYDYDAAAIEQYVEATRTPEDVRRYLEETVYGPKDHWEYLARMGGMERLAKLRADPSLGY